MKNIKKSGKFLDYNELEKIIHKYKDKPNITLKGLPKLKSGRKIYKLKWGNGNKKLITVTGLHANENSAIQYWHRSLDYALKHFSPKDLSYIILTPANPDGMDKKHHHINFSPRNPGNRVNANGVDLNRDWYAFSQKETQHMKKVIDEESIDSKLLVLDKHECIRGDIMYFIEDKDTSRMRGLRRLFFQEFQKTIKKNNLLFDDNYTAAKSGQLVNYTGENGIFSLIVEVPGQTGPKNLTQRETLHAMVDIVALEALKKSN